MTEIESEPEYNIISEQRKTYLVEKPDGQRVYVCKLCGEEIGEMNQIAKHFSQKHRHTESEDEDTDAKIVLPKSKPKPTPEKGILTPEEEMLEEMCTTLKTQMEATPGIGAGQKTEWFVNVFFRNNPILQENPQELFKALRRNFSRADDDAISWIVSAVFKVRENYRRSISATTTPRFDFSQPFLQVQPPQLTITSTTDGNTFSLMFTIMQQMMQQQQQFYNMLIHEIKSKPDPNAVRAQVENEFLRKHLERLENQLDRMTEMITESKTRAISPEGWKDDYARLIAEMGDKILTLGERIIVENKKFRQTLIKYLAPRILKTEEEHVPSGSGRTDEEIIRELEEEGLVE